MEVCASIFYFLMLFLIQLLIRLKISIQNWIHFPPPFKMLLYFSASAERRGSKTITKRCMHARGRAALTSAHAGDRGERRSFDRSRILILI